MLDTSLTRIEAGALAAYIATFATQRYAFPRVARPLVRMPNPSIFSFSVFFILNDSFTDVVNIDINQFEAYKIAWQL